MGTRSRIGIENQDGTITSVYCHWDGYLEHNGKILFETYNTEEKIRELLSYGSIGSLANDIGVQHPFDNPHPFRSPEYNEFMKMTTFYGRDRGEEELVKFTNNWSKPPIFSVEALVHPTVSDFLSYSEEYTYLFKDGKWVYRVYDSKRWNKLTERNTNS
jgi:hypothetical protein